MKSAKEWAAEVVTDAYLDDDAWIVKVHDELEYVLLEPQRREEWAQVNAADARGIIERLVERVQADARAPLDEQIARLRTRNDYVEGMAGAYESVIAGVVERLSKSLEPGADSAAYVREVIAHLKGLVTL